MQTLVVNEWNVHPLQSWQLVADSDLSWVKPVLSDLPDKSCGYIYRKFHPMTALYVCDGRLKFHVGTSVYDLELDRVRIQHQIVDDDTSKVVVYARGQVILPLQYQSEFGRIGLPRALDFMLDEETDDWWLWLAGLDKDPRWRSSIIDGFQRGL